MTSSIDLWHVTSWRRRYNLAGIIIDILGSKRIGLSGSRDVIGHVTIGFPIDYFLLMVPWNQASISLTVSEIFNGESDAMVDMTLNDL